MSSRETKTLSFNFPPWSGGVAAVAPFASLTFPPRPSEPSQLAFRALFVFTGFVCVTGTTQGTLVFIGTGVSTPPRCLKQEASWEKKRHWTLPGPFTRKIRGLHGRAAVSAARRRSEPSVRCRSLNGWRKSSGRGSVGVASVRKPPKLLQSLSFKTTFSLKLPSEPTGCSTRQIPK